MSTIEATLDLIAAERVTDTLAPVTVIVPSRLALLQLRRRLAQRGPFANVRFEVISRLAELIAAPELARAARRPLARPIGDYVAGLVAGESRGPLASVSDLDGYMRAVRQTFRRFRRGGFGRAEDVPLAGPVSQLPEITRLFGRFRTLTAPFYDEEDLLETAAATLRARSGGSTLDLGAVYVIPPVRLSAGAATFLDALSERASAYVEVEETTGVPAERFVFAPDAASEVRAVVREVVAALRDGVPLHKIAVLYSGDRTYRSLIPQTFEAAGIPVASMPGTPLNETAVGRGVLALARLPLSDYSRAALFDFLALAPLRERVPRRHGSTRLHASQWLRIAREAGITHGLERWRDGLELFASDREAGLAPESELSEARRRLFETDLDGSRHLRGVVIQLGQALEPLRPRQRAGTFIPTFLGLLDAYLRPDARGMAEVRAEVEQLGTVDSVGGDFDLVSFVEALEANLAAASFRERSLGDGLLVADYRLAAGLRFERVFLCGTYEGVFPAVAETEPLLQDQVWSGVRASHPYIDDFERRLELAGVAAARVLGVAEGGTLTWSCPLQAANARQEYYPSALMVAAARRRDPSIRTATDLRQAPACAWLTRPASPLAAMLSGEIVDRWEIRLREAIAARRGEISLSDAHPLRAPGALLRARRGTRFTEFDGNLATLHGLAALQPGASVSPTSLQNYATCGFRYFLASVLRLRGTDEPEQAATISAAERGTLVHKTLERFFRYQQARGRPRVGERWATADLEIILSIFEEEFESLRRLGRAGLAVYAGFDRRILRADLAAFLEHDSDFRLETGAVPTDFELRVPRTALGEINLTGFVDRIDRTPDGSAAFVIDYKTGRADEYEKADASDPFAGGTRLQLPVYVLAATGAERVQALYWFVSGRGEFKRVPYRETPANRERFEDTVGAILHGVRAGSFPAVPGPEEEFYNSFENCRYCPFDRVCGRRRVYELQEKQGDPGMRPWHQVSVTARGDEHG